MSNNVAPLSTRNAFARLADLSRDQLGWVFGRAVDGLRDAQTDRAGSLWGNRYDAVSAELARRGLLIVAVAAPRPTEPRYMVGPPSDFAPIRG